MTRKPADAPHRRPVSRRLRVLVVVAVVVAGVVGTLLIFGVGLRGGERIDEFFTVADESVSVTSQLGPVSGEEQTPLPERSLVPLGPGGPVRLSGYRGQALLINFWATWCVPCVTEMPVLQEMSEQSRGQVVFLGVNVQDSEDEALAFIRELGTSYDQARDPDAKFFTEVGGFGMPTTLLVDASGVIVYRHTGAVDIDQLRGLLIGHLGTEL